MNGFFATKEEYILSLIEKDSGVLHVGCTNSPTTHKRWETGTLLHQKLCSKVEESSSRVVGIDIDASALDFLRERMPREDLRLCDAHHLIDQFPDRRFDVIVAGDVIEHLKNPGQFLESCRRVLAPRGTLVTTTVNAYSVVRFAKTLFRHEAVHPDHTAYYSHKTLARLHDLCGLSVVASGYYRSEPAVGQPITYRLGTLLEGATCRFWPQWAEGVIVTSRVMVPT